jgi:hypothetical protein
VKPSTLIVRALAAGLCVVAAVAIIGLLTGSWDDTSWKIIGTAIGFSLSTATAGAGLASPQQPLLGRLTVVASIIAFVLLVIGLWTNDADHDALWRACGIAGVVALWGEHATLLVRSRRPRDSDAIRWLTGIAIVTFGINAVIAILALADAFDDVGDDAGRFIGVLVVITILCTALVAILRRLAPATRGEIAEIARRLAEMDLPPDARAEVARLRRLAGPRD